MSDLTLHPYHVTALRALPATVDELDRHARYLPELIEHGLATVAMSQPGRAPIYAPTAAGARVVTHSRMVPDTRRVERPGPTRQPLPPAKTGRWWDMREDEGDARALRLESEMGEFLADLEDNGGVHVDAREHGEPEYLAAVYEDIAAGLRWLANETECDAAGVP